MRSTVADARQRAAMMFADYIGGMKLADVAKKYGMTRGGCYTALLRHDPRRVRAVARRNVFRKPVAKTPRIYAGRGRDPELAERNRVLYERWLAGETQRSIMRSEHLSQSRVSQIIREQVRLAAAEKREAV